MPHLRRIGRRRLRLPQERRASRGAAANSAVAAGHPRDNWGGSAATRQRVPFVRCPTRSRPAVPCRVHARAIRQMPIVGGVAYERALTAGRVAESDAASTIAAPSSWALAEGYPTI